MIASIKDIHIAFLKTSVCCFCSFSHLISAAINLIIFNFEMIILLSYTEIKLQFKKSLISDLHARYFVLQFHLKKMIKTEVDYPFRITETIRCPTQSPHESPSSVGESIPGPSDLSADALSVSPWPPMPNSVRNQWVMPNGVKSFMKQHSFLLLHF